MARPTKYRRVSQFPEKDYFSPQGSSNEPEVVLLKVEELEAMRLKDIEKLNQEECAERMQVSRQTFQNIIDSGREKVADALVNGKAVKISGGHYIHTQCEWYCSHCNKSYSIRVLQDKFNCPVCGSNEVRCSRKGKMCHKWCASKVQDSE